MENSPNNLNKRNEFREKNYIIIQSKNKNNHTKSTFSFLISSREPPGAMLPSLCLGQIKIQKIIQKNCGIVKQNKVAMMKTYSRLQKREKKERTEEIQNWNEPDSSEKREQVKVDYVGYLVALFICLV